MKTRWLGFRTCEIYRSICATVPEDWNAKRKKKIVHGKYYALKIQIQKRVACGNQQNPKIFQILPTKNNGKRNKLRILNIILIRISMLSKKILFGNDVGEIKEIIIKVMMKIMVGRNIAIIIKIMMIKKWRDC